MPVRRNSAGVQVVLYTTATSLLAAVEHLIVPKREREANIWLAHAKKMALKEMATAPPTATPSDARPQYLAGYDADACDRPQSRPEQFWLCCWSPRQTSGSDAPSQQTAKCLDFVLACTSSHLGTYPIFLYSHVPSRFLTPMFLSDRIYYLVDRLADIVKTSRVFSVFGPTPLTTAFVTTWSRMSGSVAIPDPFYAAKLTTCTPKTLTKSSSPIPVGHTLRLAEARDADAAAALCKEFADDSVCFPLTYARALKEAKEMIRNRQLWVYYTTASTGEQVLASIVGCTRSTENVAAINKVYTSVDCRSQGCAGRLVRFAFNHWLFKKRMAAVILYVAHDNEPAERAYHRVGFEGLMNTTPQESEVEDWLEIGFEKTERGHW